ncbi:rCG63311 [Rattus norvegicus]|uniref:RCG63311 n=1 Tax=Rattus norvegicus TaxID=10116 RepID=A6JK15_RAT|nr:rCG63311 [Rattus norvegicus]
MGLYIGQWQVQSGLAMGTKCQTGTEFCRDSRLPGTPVAVGRFSEQHLLPTGPRNLKS